MPRLFPGLVTSFTRWAGSGNSAEIGFRLCQMSSRGMMSMGTEAPDSDRAGTVLRYMPRNQSEDGSWPFALHIGLTEQDDGWMPDFSSEMLIWLSQYLGYLSVGTGSCRGAQDGR